MATEWEEREIVLALTNSLILPALDSVPVSG